MTRQQSRINEREAEIRRQQPKIEKMIMRSRCILSECSKLSLEDRMVVAAHLTTIVSRLREPIPSAGERSSPSDSSSRSHEITGH